MSFESFDGEEAEIHELSKIQVVFLPSTILCLLLPLPRSLKNKMHEPHGNIFRARNPLLAFGKPVSFLSF